MRLHATGADRRRIRDLAGRQSELAHLPVMEKRRANWLALNTGRPAVPPVVVESWTFEPYLMPPSLLQCEGEAARQIEFQLLKAIREHELIGDDKVVPDCFPLEAVPEVDAFGVAVEERRAADADSAGRRIGFAFSHPIRDLERDLPKLSPLRASLDGEAYRQRFDFASELLSGILPVERRAIPPLVSMTEKAIKLMGMEAFCVAILEQPDALHALMRYLTDNQIRLMRFYEQQGILTLNNGNHETGASSFGFTDRLPAPGYAGAARLEDIWMWVEAEETVCISPPMFEEFCLPYFAEAAGLCGAVYYGCCEPLHDRWPGILKAIPNIRKASVSPWSDQRRMGEYLRGTGIVFSRKPFAGILGSGAALDADAWRGHIRETLEAARGCPCEIIVRDVYQVRSVDDVRLAVEIARREADASVQ